MLRRGIWRLLAESLICDVDALGPDAARPVHGSPYAAVQRTQRMRCGRSSSPTSSDVCCLPGMNVEARRIHRCPAAASQPQVVDDVVLQRLAFLTLLGERRPD